MTKKEISEVLTKMDNGSYEVFELTKTKAKKIVNGIDGHFELIALKSDKCLISKIEKKTKKANDSILDAIENLGLCKDVIVPEPISTVRGIVYRFNKKHDRKITVKDVDGECVLSEDFMSRKTYTEKDYDNVRVRAEEIVNKVKAAIDSDDVWEEDII